MALFASRFRNGFCYHSKVRPFIELRINEIRLLLNLYHDLGLFINRLFVCLRGVVHSPHGERGLQFEFPPKTMISKSVALYI